MGSPASSKEGKSTRRRRKVSKQEIHQVVSSQPLSEVLHHMVNENYSLAVHKLYSAVQGVNGDVDQHLFRWRYCQLIETLNKNPVNQNSYLAEAVRCEETILKNIQWQVHGYNCHLWGSLQTRTNDMPNGMKNLCRQG